MDTRTTIEKQYVEYFQAHDEIPDRWLLMQNIAFTPTRRAVIDALDIAAGQQVLDLGCGFGMLSFDLAAVRSVQVSAVDVDVHKLDVARDIRGSLGDMESTMRGSVSFGMDDANQLKFDDDVFDWVISQHVFQHLEQPEQVLQEVYRVLKPGGCVCLVDVDDGLGVSYPEHESFVRLGEILERVQELRGGDRRIGRKLPYLLHEAGFTVQATTPLMQSQFVSASDKRTMLAVLAEHVSDVRSDVIARGLMESDEFDNLLHEVVHNPVPASLEMNTEFVTLGQKPLVASASNQR